LHGLDAWKKVYQDNYDKIIFLGDYVDSYDLEDKTILRNFIKVIEFRLKYPEKVILLTDNHEVGYLNSKYRCMGYRPEIEGDIKALLQENGSIFRVAWQYGNHLWMHTGINQPYFDRYIRDKVSPAAGASLASTLNNLYAEKYDPLFEIGKERGSDRKAIGGPFLLHRTILAAASLKG